MMTLRQRLKKFVDAFFPPVPTRRMVAKPLYKLVDEGYVDFYCTRSSYSALIHLVPPFGAKGATAAFCGKIVYFKFNEWLEDGWFIPVKTGSLMLEDAQSV